MYKRQPDGFDPALMQQKKMVTTQHVLVDNAVKTPQFYLLFGVLMLNVTAGIGVLGQASVMIQELFSEASVGAANAIDAKKAAGFVMLLSLFNMVGRFFWSSSAVSYTHLDVYKRQQSETLLPL